MQAFVAVADAMSYTKAAAALNSSQPTLSRHVQLLEKELGQRLLERHGRGVRVTDSGAALLVHVRGILEAVDHAKAEMSERLQSPRGKIRIGLPPRVAQSIAPDLVQQFLRACPDASITVEEGLSIRLREWLIAGRLDMAILFDPPSSQQLQIEGLERELLLLVGIEPLPSKVKVSAVGEFPLILPSEPQALRRIFQAVAERKDVRLHVVAEVDSMQTVLSLVERKVGYTVIPSSVAKMWNATVPLHTALLTMPQIRNRITLAVPCARPSTRLHMEAAKILKRLIHQTFSI